jgi:hypothetical protein
MRSVRDFFGGRDYDVRFDRDFETKLLNLFAKDSASAIANQVLTRQQQLLTPLTQKVDGLTTAVNKMTADLAVIKSDVAATKQAAADIAAGLQNQADLDALYKQLQTLHDQIKDSNDKLEAARSAATPK